MYTTIPFPLTANIFSLPVELLDNVLSLLPDAPSLLSFALTCKHVYSVAAPRHTAYRSLRLLTGQAKLPTSSDVREGGDVDEGKVDEWIWERLGRRVDLARNVRAVHVIEESVGGQMKREGAQEEVLIARALMNMTNLEKITWIQPWGVGTWSSSEGARLRDEVWGALRRCENLKEIRVFESAGCVDDEDLSDSSPFWTLRDLESISLEGQLWRNPKYQSKLESFILQSPNVQNLSLPSPLPATSPFWNAALPRLAKVTLPSTLVLRAPFASSLPVPATPTSFDYETVVLNFLCAHSTIEDLTWHPSANSFKPPLPAHLLPGLRRVDTTHDFLKVFLDDETADADAQPAEARSIEALGTLLLNLETIKLLKGLSSSALKELAVRVSWGEGTEALKQVAAMFPNIKTLDLGVWAPRTSEECVDVLGVFRNLESLPGLGIWEWMQKMPAQDKKNILQLMLKNSPKLRKFGDWDNQAKRAADVILDVASDGGLETVDWRVCPRKNRGNC